MKKAIVSFAHGDEFNRMLEIALPTFYRYGTKYNYDVICPSYNNVIEICRNFEWDYNRPTSWLKVPIIKYFLNSYDVVLWLDSDIIITKKSPDITQYIENDTLQGVTVHADLYEGLVPNCGVWLVTNKFSNYLDDVWAKTEYINHHWWEQMAVIELMNWLPKSKTQKLSEYGLSTVGLPYEFNVHKNDIRFNEDSIKSGYFLHATMWKDREKTMKEWIDTDE